MEMIENRYIIALGASAGGLPALIEFFDNTLPDSVSYIITTHLYTYQKSQLAELLQTHSAIKIYEVEHNMVVQPNTVYVMPENKVMSITDGRLILSDRNLSIKVNYAIDIFFVSLAKDILFKKIVIILSGMGTDGTKGVNALAKKGGYIIAQDPSSAQYSSMPMSVIDGEFINQVLSPKQMPSAIIEHIASVSG